MSIYIYKCVNIYIYICEYKTIVTTSMVVKSMDVGKGKKTVRSTSLKFAIIMSGIPTMKICENMLLYYMKIIVALLQLATYGILSTKYTN